MVIPGGTVPTAVSTMALARLNMITKQLQGGSDLMPGVKVHTRQRVQLWLAKGQHQYLVGPASGDARCATTWGRTTISALEAAGQTTLSVTAITDTTTFPGTTVTICNLLLQNGYSVRGESSCVDPDNFNEATGKRIAYENAVHALWPLEGYLLAEEIYRAKEASHG